MFAVRKRSRLDPTTLLIPSLEAPFSIGFVDARFMRTRVKDGLGHCLAPKVTFVDWSPETNTRGMA
jgi:hypothetical protein